MKCKNLCLKGEEQDIKEEDEDIWEGLETVGDVVSLFSFSFCAFYYKQNNSKHTITLVKQ